jgi:hypothetical protein
MLSIIKLEKILVNKGIFPERFYTYHNYVIYVECLIIKTGIKFWIDIPENYKFKIEKSNNVFDLKSVTIDEGDDEVVNEFAKKFNDLDVFNAYEEKGDIDIDDDFDQNNISSKLSQNYNYSIRISEIDESDEKDVKDIKRQVSRLRYSVMHTKYQVCITYKHYFAILYENEVIVFAIRNYGEDEFSRYRQLFVTVDLELFYSKLDNISNEVFKIKSSISKILDINYNKNINNINFMMDKSALILNKFQELYSKKIHLIGLESRFEELYKSVNDSEKKIIEKIILLKDQENSHESIKKYKGNLKALEDSKLEILNNVAKVNEKRDNISLTLDKILFDNIVMFNSIIKNFEILLSFND